MWLFVVGGGGVKGLVWFGCCCRHFCRSSCRFLFVIGVVAVAVGDAVVSFVKVLPIFFLLLFSCRRGFCRFLLLLLLLLLLCCFWLVVIGVAFVGGVGGDWCCFC